MARRTRVLSAEQKSVLTAVRRVARQRSRINDSYVTAIVEARQSGVTYASIADAVGTSSQAVQEIVRRHLKVEQIPAKDDQPPASSDTQDDSAPTVGAPAGAIAAITGDDDHSQAGGSGAAGSGGPGAAQGSPSPAL